MTIFTPSKDALQQGKTHAIEPYIAFHIKNPYQRILYPPKKICRRVKILTKYWENASEKFILYDID